MPFIPTSFSNFFQKSLGRIHKDFYQKEELDFLERELFQIYEEFEKAEVPIYIKIYSHENQDRLLRFHLTCVAIVCKSLPFFAGKIRHLFHIENIPISRSLQFHPAEGKEFYYIEVNLENKDSVSQLQSQFQDIYYKIKNITQSYSRFMEESNKKIHFFKSDFQTFFEWLTRSAFIWEGGLIITNNEKESYGLLVPEELEKSWLTYCNQNSDKENLFCSEINLDGYLEETKLYFIGIHSKAYEIGLVGSFNQYAHNVGVNNIPILNARFKNFLHKEKIEPLSGLGRSVRRIFNSLPPEILFLIPEEHYLSLYQVIIEQSLRTKVSSSGFIIGKDLGIIITLIPAKHWEESKWEEAIKIIDEHIPKAICRAFYKNLSDTMQSFHLIRSLEISAINLFHVTSHLEIHFTPWIEILQNKWESKFKDILFPKNLVFRKDYIATHDTDHALYDLELANNLGNDKLILSIDEGNDCTIIQAITKDAEFPLSKWVYTFNVLGLSAISQRVYRFILNDKTYSKIEFYFNTLENRNQLYERLKQAIYYTMHGKLPADDLSKLVLKTNLNANGVYFLKSIRDYCLQTNPYFNKNDFNEVLLEYDNFSSGIWEYFQEKFQKGNSITNQKIKELSNQAKTIREDEILKAFRTAVEGIVRTNFFGGNEDKNFNQKIGLEREVISYKIDSSIPSSLPNPRPYREIFVYSSQIMGIHLRGGKVARGGLRHSDRISDFRTEILSLMKTQMVKNTVIVPVGSKGGFVILKNPFVVHEIPVVEAYKQYIRGLLSLTDNRKEGQPYLFAKPNGPYAYDEYDPYLVVAADKGTATFSDIANEISQNFEFWLGDAFASGGSRGYSHKEYGITAKGALVTGDRRLRSLGLDLLQDPITVVGIGDLGGDVFGNGLLFSKYLKLVAAFNHKHIFLDPNPDLEKSYEERIRLFHSKNSGWDFYNKEVISKGGGVFLKTEKAIPISNEVKQVLGIEEDVLSGTALIRAILKAPVDMFYNGGIGTYVKSQMEDNSEVGDPTNNEYRINGNEVRARVVCEGGNLGFTQLGRIEYCIQGGKIYTDAIDNSAGVDLSDHEVNLKLLFSHLINKGVVKDEEERDQYLKEIASNVCEKVLLDNNLQSLSIDTDEYESQTLGWEQFIKVSHYFISKGILNPITEKIPANQSEWEELKEKTKQIPTPILCVLLAYSKMDLYNESIQTNIFQLEDFENIYNFYFPNSILNQFRPYLSEHPLKKEILLTQLVNFYVNLMGSKGILLLIEHEKQVRMEKFREILLYLKSHFIFEFLNELSVIRNKNLERENSILLSKIRNKIRLKWMISSKLDLSEFRVIHSISGEILQSILNL